MKKRITSLFIMVAMLISLIPVFPMQVATVVASTKIKIGDYVQMGKYYNEPILWRCVDIDENGALMLSDKILTIKAFDAASPDNKTHKYLDGTDQLDTTGRARYGSDLWETSNIRSWLNSTASAGNVIWLDGCPPTKEKVQNGANAYDGEKGFLAEGNFTISEQNAIKSVTQKSLLNPIDIKLQNGVIGDNHKMAIGISDIVQNYDTANCQMVTDKMFLLDIKQLNKVYLHSDVLGTDYWIGKPTQKAVDNSTYKASDLSANLNYHNWNRSPYADKTFPYSVRCVSYGGIVVAKSAFDGSAAGARPAFYIDLTTNIFKSGDGSIGTPYLIGTKLSSPEIVQPSSNIIKEGSDIDLEWKPVEGVASYEIKIRDITKATDESGDLIFDAKSVNDTKITILKSELLKQLITGNKYRVSIAACVDIKQNMDLRGNTDFIFTVSNIRIGDYVQMGKYYDDPIIWRCVDIDENGALMLSDKILTNKPFDVVGDHTYLDGTSQLDTTSDSNRKSKGSNLWATSNIRSWLNSSNTSDKIVWLDGTDPTKVYGNPYAGENGFLSEGNFSKSEQNAIKNVEQKSLLNGIDVKLNTDVTATTSYTLDINVATILQNYDIAYSHKITDKMFLLDVKQLNNVYKNSAILGQNYWIGKPTQKAVDKSAYKPATLSVDLNWYSWIRSPFADSGSPFGALYEDINGPIYPNAANDNAMGVRPAFYMDWSYGIFKSGNGSIETPYKEIPVTSVSINNLETSVFASKTLQLTAQVTPTDATSQTVTWSVFSQSDTNIATVSDTGLVTAINPGTAVIRATSDSDITKYADYNITVNPYGDINADNIVDINDLNLLGKEINTKSTDTNWNKSHDISDDNVIDIYDLVKVSKSIPQK